jgi:hypothetical protein
MLLHQEPGNPKGRLDAVKGSTASPQATKILQGSGKQIVLSATEMKSTLSGNVKEPLAKTAWAILLRSRSMGNDIHRLWSSPIGSNPSLSGDPGSIFAADRNLREAEVICLKAAHGLPVAGPGISEGGG